MVRINRRRGAQRSQVLFPSQAPGEIVTIKALGTKERDDVCAIGRHGAVGVRGLGMAFADRNTFVGRRFPHDRARSLVQAIDHPTLDVIVVGGRRVAVITNPEPHRFALIDSGGEEQALSPDYRTGVAQAGNGGAPGMLLDCATFQVAAVISPGAIPWAPAPRNDGQLSEARAALADAPAHTARQNRRSVIMPASAKCCPYYCAFVKLPPHWVAPLI